MSEVKSPQTIYLVAHQQYQNWCSARFDVADIEYYHYAYVERLRAANAELVDALEAAQVSALKLAHMVFVCTPYKGRMADIMAEVDLLRRGTTSALNKAKNES